MTEEIAYTNLKTYIAENTGIIYYRDKDNELKRKADKRMNSLGMKTFAQYVDLITNGTTQADKEFDLLINELTIGETYFFRDKETFRGLRETIIPGIIEKNRESRQIRIWSAGCASGEEPYSLSIMLRTEFPHQLDGWEINILGTDINRDFLSRAIEGRYTSWSFRETPEDIKNNSFITNKKMMEIKPQFKKGVTFQYHNLVKHPFPSLVHNIVAFDIVLCRNVIIYFDGPTIQRLLAKFEGCLVPDGWFVVGHADHNIHYFSRYNPLNVGGAYFYQRKEDDNGEIKEPPVFKFDPSPPPTPSWPPVKPREAPGAETFPPAAPPSAPPVQPPPSAAPTGSDAQLQELRSLTNSGKWEEAHTLAEEIQDRDVMNPVVHFYHALVHEQRGEIEEAEKSMRKTLYLDRSFIPGHFHLGLMHQNRHNIKGARKSFENVVRLVSDYDSGHIFDLVDNIAAAQLKELAQFHLEVLNKYEDQH